MKRKLRTHGYSVPSNEMNINAIIREQKPQLLKHVQTFPDKTGSNRCGPLTAAIVPFGFRVFWDGEQFLTTSGRNIVCPAELNQIMPREKLDCLVWDSVNFSKQTPPWRKGLYAWDRSTTHILLLDIVQTDSSQQPFLQRQQKLCKLLAPIAVVNGLGMESLDDYFAWSKKIQQAEFKEYSSIAEIESKWQKNKNFVLIHQSMIKNDKIYEEFLVTNVYEAEVMVINVSRSFLKCCVPKKGGFAFHAGKTDEFLVQLPDHSNEDHKGEQKTTTTPIPKIPEMGDFIKIQFNTFRARRRVPRNPRFVELIPLDRLSKEQQESKSDFMIQIIKKLCRE